MYFKRTGRKKPARDFEPGMLALKTWSSTEWSLYLKVIPYKGEGQWIVVDGAGAMPTKPWHKATWPDADELEEVEL